MELTKVTSHIFTAPRGTDVEAMSKAIREHAEGPACVILLNEGEKIEELTDEVLAQAGLMRIPEEAKK